MGRTITIELSEADVALLIEALDSHEYWQLSESHERNDGYSTIPDGQNDEVDAARDLIVKLERSLATEALASSTR